MQLANFRQIMKTPPCHYFPLISDTTAHQEKKHPAAPPFFVVFFHWQVQELTCWCKSLRDRSGNRSIYMTSNRPFEHLLFCAGRGEQKVASFFKGKKKPFESLTSTNLFSFLPSFAPFFHSCFPYSSPNLRLISAINIHEVRCNDQSTSWWCNMKGFWRPVTVTSLRQDVLLVINLFLVLSGSVISSRANSLKNKHKKQFWHLVAFFSCRWKVINAFILRCSPHTSL